MYPPLDHPHHYLLTPSDTSLRYISLLSLGPFYASCYRNGRLEFSNLLKVTAGQDLNLGGLTLEPSLSIPLGALPRNEEPELRSPLPHPCCVTADQTLPLWDLVSPSDRGLTGAKVYF